MCLGGHCYPVALFLIRPLNLCSKPNSASENEKNPTKQEIMKIFWSKLQLQLIWIFTKLYVAVNLTFCIVKTDSTSKAIKMLISVFF